MTAQYASLMNMAQQNETAKRQAAQAQQKMDFDAAEEARAVAMQEPNLRKAGSEADAAQIKMLSDFTKLSIEVLKQAQSAEDAVIGGNYLKSNFKDPRLQASVDQTVAKLTADPANFEPARQQFIFQAMDVDKQLDQRIANMTTGDETYQVSAPKYAGAPGGMAATEVPGTRVKAPQGITYVKDDQGNVFGMPTKTSGGPATPAPAGSPGGGSPVANALKTNPGALKDGPFAKSQPGYTGKSGGFATFKTPQDGIAAQEKLLRNSYINKGANTINKIVNKYAPQGPENSAASVSGYKEYIRQRTGIGIDAPITAAQIPAVAQAMREFETNKKVSGRGAAGAPVAVIKGSNTKANEALTAKEAAVARYDETIAVAKRLLANPGLDGILGNIQGNIPETVLSLYSQDAANALADYNTLLTTAGFQELQAMRDASPTGGALGQVAVEENKMLQKSAFASSRTQAEAKFKQAVKDYISRLERSRSRVVGAFDRQFGGRVAPAAARTPTTPTNTGKPPLDSFRRK
jgi:hypothetical protein